MSNTDAQCGASDGCGRHRRIRHGRGHSLWGFGLREVAHTSKLGHRGVGQDPGRLFKDVATRDRVVKPPYEMQWTIPRCESRFPPTMVNRAFGVVLDKQVPQLVPFCRDIPSQRSSNSTSVSRDPRTASSEERALVALTRLASSLPTLPTTGRISSFCVRVGGMRCRRCRSSTR